MIYELLKNGKLADALGEFHPFPRYDERGGWDNLPDAAKKSFVKSAQEIKDKVYPSLPASVYIDFVRTGDRARYESMFNIRRMDLMTLVVAECVEASGEYIDAIINLIWLICEETSWVVPAHNNKGELPDIEYEIFVDLFSSETGSVISWAYYFLADEIAKVSPTAKRRMEIEVDKRILTPYLTYNHFWYMGFSKAGVNNWNPWVNSNVIACFAILGKDRLIEGVEKLARSTDVFIDSYSEDGACDEGPGYFGAAGAALFDFMEILYDMTNGKINIFDDELIKNMGRYIYRVYIGKSYYVNFADGSARPGAPGKLLARVGAAMGDENLTAFSNHIIAANPERTYSVGWHNYRTIKSLFQGEIKSKPFNWPKVHWFKDNQILTARDTEGTSKGMFIAAKGGHNAESHNHNDIGSFVVYIDENPVIVDAGVETYTKKTFSPERYTIWTMQSCYHSLPTINGHDQLNGREYRASDVQYESDGDVTKLSMELKGAYPANSGIDSFVRSFTFAHGKEFVVNDKYSLESVGKPYIFNAVCADKPALASDGVIKLGDAAELLFDSAALTMTIEEIPLIDGRINKDWQRDYLYRLRLTEKTAVKANDITVRIRKI
jgi:Heparinase II/III-like protein.